MAGRDDRDAFAVVVSAGGGAPGAVRVDVVLPADVLARVDAHADRRGMDRSGFLIEAAEREMARS